MKIISRAEALEAGLKRYYTGKPCRKGHVAERYVAGGSCLTCREKWRAENRERQAELGRRWAENNPERRAKSVRRWKDDNPERKAELNRRWKDDNPERHAESQKRWAKNNPEKVLANCSLRRARKLNSTPPDVDLEAIELIYAAVPGISALLCEPCEVDHIIPLHAGVEAGGIHCASNLQIITAHHNRKKSSRENFEFGPPVFEQVTYITRIN